MESVDRAHAVILAGGRGTRFWPLSRRKKPKQLLDMTGAGSLLRLTSDRLAGLIPPERQWVITSAELADAVAEELPELPRHQIIGEPAPRNTAPAVALAATLILSRHGDVPFTVLPSDHLITPTAEYQASLATALGIAMKTDLLLTFGVVPGRPETGYGYIQQGPPLADAAPACRVERFTEKPDRTTAESYIAGGGHLWNSGMFAWRPSVLLEGLRSHLPGTVEAVEACADAGQPGTPAFDSALEEAYGVVDSISIDYALMERAANAAVLPVHFVWNDVGHWLAMAELWPADGHGNSSHGRLLALDSKDCIVYGPDRLTALLGVEGLVVVQTADVTLVCAADRAQDVKRLLEELETSGDTSFS